MTSATTTRNPKNLFNTISSTTVNTLKISMAAGNKIYASDVNSLISLYNTMNSHYHRYDDAYQLPTYGTGYGDNPGGALSGAGTWDRTNYYEDKDTSVPVSGASIGGISVGNTITASKHNEIATQSRNLSSHYHTINDRTNI